MKPKESNRITVDVTTLDKESSAGTTTSFVFNALQSVDSIVDSILANLSSSTFSFGKYYYEISTFSTRGLDDKCQEIEDALMDKLK